MFDLPYISTSGIPPWCSWGGFPVLLHQRPTSTWYTGAPTSVSKLRLLKLSMCSPASPISPTHTPFQLLCYFSLKVLSLFAALDTHLLPWSSLKLGSMSLHPTKITPVKTAKDRHISNPVVSPLSLRYLFSLPAGLHPAALALFLGIFFFTWPPLCHTWCSACLEGVPCQSALLIPSGITPTSSYSNTSVLLPLAYLPSLRSQMNLLALNTT